jgi:hypothetical protein
MVDASADDQQEELFPEPESGKKGRIQELTDRLKDKFGENAINRAATLIHRKKS